MALVFALDIPAVIIYVAEAWVEPRPSSHWDADRAWANLEGLSGRSAKVLLHEGLRSLLGNELILREKRAKSHKHVPRTVSQCPRKGY